MPKEVFDTHEWFCDGTDLPSEQQVLAVEHTLSRIRREIGGKLVSKPAIGIDERRPGLIVCQGLTPKGPFTFATSLEEILEGAASSKPVNHLQPNVFEGFVARVRKILKLFNNES